MSDSDWSTLQQRCADNGAWLGLRVDMFKSGEHRYALTATERKVNGEVLNQLRADSTDNAPQYVTTQLVTQALAEWWA